VTLTFTLIPEKPMLRYVLMNPRTTLVVLGVTAALAVTGFTAFAFQGAQLDSVRAKLAACEATVTAQTTAAQAVADAATARAEAAERAADAAREAGRADRLAARRYLDLPTPAPADRCDAAQALVDEAITENRS